MHSWFSLRPHSSLAYSSSPPDVVPIADDDTLASSCNQMGASVGKLRFRVIHANVTTRGMEKTTPKTNSQLSSRKVHERSKKVGAHGVQCVHSQSYPSLRVYECACSRVSFDHRLGEPGTAGHSREDQLCIHTRTSCGGVPLLLPTSGYFPLYVK
jgi:hypothetical protein